ncbi:jacalin-related lectin 19-like [Triticum aestivum]|nr:jacalin-related lectin 19-like [Triticum aestivum]
MEKAGSKVTVKVEEPNLEGHGGGSNSAAPGGGSTAVLPLQQGALLPADRFAVVLPDISLGAPATITVSIGDHRSEAKAAEDKLQKVKAKGHVLKMGPCGGPRGDAWKMDVRGGDRIVKVILWHAGAVDAISVSYERDGRIEQTEHWGKLEGRQRSEICLEPDEYLTGMKGHVGEFGGSFLVGALTLVGNRRSFGPYGTRKGPPFELPAAGGRIVGFHGRSGGLIDALGIYVETDN